eukprot:CAMPEP_0197413882 /NCGR_PEP_ID=MMETSP1170-20131217/685_1 /TAXON_ID=54406 /ORGANISM="Sarcinochrysis sp, Strain CCMP770" /LENGTH=245 /DNA_ID=CAMNT_0042940533 /DNA_START=1 /DNA_END=735 /DNA_ORIENTATION=-
MSSHSISTLLRKNGIIQTHSSPGLHHQNGKCESEIKRLKHIAKCNLFDATDLPRSPLIVAQAVEYSTLQRNFQPRMKSDRCAWLLAYAHSPFMVNIYTASMPKLLHFGQPCVFHTFFRDEPGADGKFMGLDLYNTRVGYKVYDPHTRKVKTRGTIKVTHSILLSPATADDDTDSISDSDGDADCDDDASSISSVGAVDLPYPGYHQPTPDESTDLPEPAAPVDNDVAEPTPSDDHSLHHDSGVDT